MSRRVLPAGPKLAQRARTERQERRRRQLRRAGWVLAALGPFVALGWLLLASPWLVVHRIVVVGESRLTAAQVLSAVDVRLGVPLARVDTNAVAARVRALGPVASVSVSRGWPDTLKVTVVEREPVAAVAAGKAWTLYDGTGAELGSAATVPPGVVKLMVSHPGVDDPTTEAALAVLGRLPKGLRQLVLGVSARSAEEVTLWLTKHRRVVWGGTADGAAKAAALVPLLRMPGHVYDVSSPTVVTRR
jgi:cell division protein FtsQ